MSDKLKNNPKSSFIQRGELLQQRTLFQSIQSYAIAFMNIIFLFFVTLIQPDQMQVGSNGKLNFGSGWSSGGGSGGGGGGRPGGGPGGNGGGGGGGKRMGGINHGGTHSFPTGGCANGACGM